MKLKRIWIHFKRVKKGNDNMKINKIKKRSQLKQEKIKEKNKTIAQLKITYRHCLEKLTIWRKGPEITMIIEKMVDIGDRQFEEVHTTSYAFSH